MKVFRHVLSLVGFFLLATCAVQAQATRTWISGVGDDANPCSRTAPCKTFAGAISKTAAGGEIDNLDTGGFGALTITKAITLDGGGGQVASILVAGTNGITVAAGLTDVVTIRNISFQGLAGTASPGVNGIQLNSAGALHIEHCAIMGFGSNGIAITPTSMPAAGTQVFIEDTLSQNNGAAGSADYGKHRQLACERSQLPLHGECQWGRCRRLQPRRGFAQRRQRKLFRGLFGCGQQRHISLIHRGFQRSQQHRSWCASWRRDRDFRGPLVRRNPVGERNGIVYRKQRCNLFLSE